LGDFSFLDIFQNVTCGKVWGCPQFSLWTIQFCLFYFVKGQLAPLTVFYMQSCSLTWTSQGSFPKLRTHTLWSETHLLYFTSLSMSHLCFAFPCAVLLPCDWPKLPFKF
jgi:hypothetical protein